MKDIITDNYKLLHGDCLERMKEIPDGSVDTVLCDLPYGTTQCSWDNIINFELMWEQLNRITKDNTPIVLFGSQPFTSNLIMSNPKMFREELIWLKNKAGSGLQAKQKHIKVHENILLFSKNGKYTFNPQKWLVDKKEFLTQRKTFNDRIVGNNVYSEMVGKRNDTGNERNPISIVSCRVPFTPQKNRSYSSDVDLRYHPTQKPVALLEYLIKTYTKENETVLDFTAGSFSTAIACLNTDRNFIGIELDDGYFDIGVNRIKEHIESNNMNVNLTVKD